MQFEAEKVALQSPEVQQLLKKYYGLDKDDISRVRCEPWTVGYNGFQREHSTRLANCFMFMYASDTDDYMYAHPIEGIVPLVDLDGMQLYDIEVFEEYMPKQIPSNEYHYTHAALGDEYYASDLQPLEVVQPNGASFSFDGNVIKWHKWTMHIGFTPREGMVLNDIHFNGRKILHRLNLSEMTVPYGAAAPPHNRKHAIDVSEYNFGTLLMPQQLGKCCLGHIAYIDTHTCNTDGSVATCENAICIHEIDDGLLWKQVDWRTGQTETRRRRILSISSYAQVLNYGYAPRINFGPEGKIEFHIEHTGSLMVGAGSENSFGTEVAPGVLAHHHQHLFSIRMDWSLDESPQQQLAEVNFEEPTANEMAILNGYRDTRSAFVARKTTLAYEQQAIRNANTATGRYWKVEAADKKNSIGHNVAYKIIATGATMPLASEYASYRKRNPFVEATFNGIQYNDDDQRKTPSGPFPAQSPYEKGGLTSWRKENLTINDPVTFVTIGVNHATQPEDQPIMPRVDTSLELAPSGFFDSNPSNNLPPSTSTMSQKVNTCHAC